MQSIYARGVSEALYLGKQALESSGREVQTRNGVALEFPTPVMTTYTHSRERVLFYPERDANPYFHLMESFWMLAGRNDVKWISDFNGRINTYSDDGEHFHGAYGFRWREWFGKDQLETARFRLSTYENDRRVVVGMWDPWEDLVQSNDGKDYPCNTQIMFWVRDEDLNMTVCNRSNDMIWGAYGANAVHMSVLLEYMAGMLGYGVGTYYQFSNNLHAYVDVLKKLDGMTADYEPYLTIADDGLSYNPPALIGCAETFDEELKTWFQDEDLMNYENDYLGTTAAVMRKSWRLWKQKDIKAAHELASNIEDRAWRKACVEWLERRM
jgi:thymidylate synthase